tara:strand:+ start:3948 stop:5270 length:1323 start_codon:yes stop_codon:yes gene_type:complete
MKNNTYLYKEKKPNFDYYSSDKKNLDITFHGLPKKIMYCKKCLVNNQKPTMRSEHGIKKGDKNRTVNFFDGVCEACIVKEKYKSIDWKEREIKFKEILDKYRSKNGSYDVVVPGSGGKDSFYVAHQLKYKYKMNPITVTFSPFIYTEWGWKNLINWTNAGFENYLNTPNPIVYRLLSRIALENMFHPWHPWILGQKNFPPKFAKNFKIPLVIYGDSPSEYGSPLKEYSPEYDVEWHTCKNEKDIFLSGESLETLKSFGLNDFDLYPFTPLLKKSFIESNIKCLAFSYFHQWHPQGNYYYSIENSDFNISKERTAGTYSKFNSIDDKLDDFYYYTYYIKFGMGRSTTDVSQEIRNGDINFEEGKSLIKKYDGEFPDRFSKECLEYLSIDEEKFGKKISNLFEKPILDRNYFDQMADSFRSPHLWKKTNQGFELRKSIDDFF